MVEKRGGIGRNKWNSVEKMQLPNSADNFCFSLGVVGVGENTIEGEIWITCVHFYLLKSDIDLKIFALKGLKFFFFW